MIASMYLPPLVKLYQLQSSSCSFFQSLSNRRVYYIRFVLPCASSDAISSSIHYIWVLITYGIRIYSRREKLIKLKIYILYFPLFTLHLARVPTPAPCDPITIKCIFYSSICTRLPRNILSPVPCK